MRFAVAKDQLSEIFVGGKQKCLLNEGDPEHLRVLNSWRGLGNEKNVVTTWAKR